MGTVQHITMIVTSFDEKKLTRTRNKALKLLDKRNITRITGEGINGYKSFVVTPNGSKAYWEDDIKHRKGIQNLRQWIDNTMPYEDGSTAVRYVITEFGEIGLKSEDENRVIVDAEEQSEEHPGERRELNERSGAV